MQFPELVKGLAILGGGNKLKVAPWLLEATSSSLTFSTAVDRLVQWSFHPDTPEKIKVLTARRMLENRPSVVHSDFLACSGYEAGECVKDIRCPALILCAPDDKMVPISQSQYLAASIPNAHLVVIPDTGHMLMLEKPQAVCEALSGFGLSIFG
jgi:pimeloyl-ACP methyl ester carboxylesterase